MSTSKVIASLTLAALALAGCSSHKADDAPRPAESASTTAGTDEEAIARYLAQNAEMYGIVNPPTVQRVRLASLAELGTLVAQCLQDQGFDAEASPDGSWSVTATAEQATAADLAEYTCVAQYPLDPDQNRPLTADQKDVVADYLLDTLVTCLADEGYDVQDVPSRDTFLAGYTDSAPWNPYTQLLPTLRNAELATLEVACPMNTPPDLLYGQ